LPLEPDALLHFAEARGGTLFAAAARLLGGEELVAAQGGRLWSLVDLAFRISDRSTAELALKLAPAAPRRLPRSLAMLAALASRDRAAGLNRRRRQGSPARVLRAMVAGLTGR
jgi:phytoene synthase